MSKDLRVQKTQNAILSTIKQMILEMDPKDITIKELTDRAMIHRKTFYLHYTCIEALFEELLNKNIEEYIAYIEKYPADSDFKVFNKVFFEFMSTREPYIEKLVCSDAYKEFSDKLFLSTRNYNRGRYNPYASFSKEKQNIINTYLCTTSNNIYRQWVADGKKIPLDELIEFSESLLCNGIYSILK